MSLTLLVMQDGYRHQMFSLSLVVDMLILLSMLKDIANSYLRSQLVVSMVAM